VTTTPFVPWPAGLVLVLASASPRRAELLRTAGIPFEVHPAPGAEIGEAAVNGVLRREPGRYAMALAAAKATAVAARLPGRLVLGADTIVILAGEILEKPLDDADARRILGMLAGRRHTVITAVALRGGMAREGWSGWEETVVEFLPLDADTIVRYVATGEPRDKAGAYGIQGYGALMIRRVEGCYFNVMGLPLALLGRALRELLGPEAGPTAKGRS
jgi:septum formation protein